MKRRCTDLHSFGRVPSLPLACVALMVVLLVSCATAVSKVDPWFSVDDGVVSIRLDANATTGYGWVVSVEGDSVEVLGDEYVPYAAPSSMVGVGGVWKCSIGAIADGTSLVRFDYARPWDLSDVADSRLLSIGVSSGRVVSAEELPL